MTDKRGRGAAWTVVRLLPVILTLSACGGAPAPEALQSDYAAARAATEAGNLAEAADAYRRLIGQYSETRFGPSLRLEYAYVLLYADDVAGAKREAEAVLTGQTDPETRARAELVAAIAAHEQVKVFLASRPGYERAMTAARATYARLEGVARDIPEIDPDNVILARLRALREDIAGLELQKMRAEIAAGQIAIAAERAAYILSEFGDTERIAAERAYLTNVAQAAGS